MAVTSWVARVAASTVGACRCVRGLLYGLRHRRQRCCERLRYFCGVENVDVVASSAGCIHFRGALHFPSLHFRHLILCTVQCKASFMSTSSKVCAQLLPGAFLRSAIVSEMRCTTAPHNLRQRNSSERVTACTRIAPVAHTSTSRVVENVALGCLFGGALLGSRSWYCGEGICSERTL
jgi:hypothetical protein